MEWQIIYTAAFGVFVWFLHHEIGIYPPPLPRSTERKAVLYELLLLWGVAMVFPLIRLRGITPWLEQLLPGRTLRELVTLPLLSIPYLLLPLWIVRRKYRWSWSELGLGWRSCSPEVSLAALLFGLGSGIIAWLTQETVLGADVLPAGVLLLLLYNNSFLEEFYHRGVIQAKLERLFGQKWAILAGGLLFGMTHILLDVTRLWSSEGALAVLLALSLQCLGGWLLGIVYMKTRSLWPGVACHYLVNWLPGILAGFG